MTQVSLEHNNFKSEAQTKSNMMKKSVHPKHVKDPSLSNKVDFDVTTLEYQCANGVLLNKEIPKAGLNKRFYHRDYDE